LFFGIHRRQSLGKLTSLGGESFTLRDDLLVAGGDVVAFREE
jgi:hypothetical protein